jgi:predicted hydrocarbon binding protein
MVGDARCEVEGKPLIVRIVPAFTAQVGEQACALFTGALEELVQLYAGRPLGLVHSRCEARGDGACEWRLDGA